MSEEKPAHPPVEGPESPLEDTRRPEEIPERELASVREEREALDEELRSVRGDLEALKKQSQDTVTKETAMQEKLVRLQADFENFRRRSRDEAAAATNRGREDVLRALLPTLDNLDRALAHNEDEGLRLISRQLNEAMASQGVVIIDPTGDTFDAALHEAIAKVEKEGVEADVIIDVAEKGYMLEGRVLRPAKVIVAG